MICRLSAFRRNTPVARTFPSNVEVASPAMNQAVRAPRRCAHVRTDTPVPGNLPTQGDQQ
ncbi:hypothetical protein BSLA_01f0785 [Burkholderia stabilis]|nr:hypothetical protein BSLA_01f0785 [Burkholderia stabilis]